MEIKDIEDLAELSKIELSDSEKKALLKDLDGICQISFGLKRLFYLSVT